MNLIKEEKSKFGPYVRHFSDNVASYRMTSIRTVVFTLTKAVSPYWFTYKRAQSGHPAATRLGPDLRHQRRGQFRRDASGSEAGLRVPLRVGSEVGQYATNPIWQVVDGPWRLSQFVGSTGYAAFVPNPHYSGADKPRSLASSSCHSHPTKRNLTRSGQARLITFYIPTQDVSQIPTIKASGYRTTIGTAGPSPTSTSITSIRRRGQSWPSHMSARRCRV